jgi:hypothetical protein
VATVEKPRKAGDGFRGGRDPYGPPIDRLSLAQPRRLSEGPPGQGPARTALRASPLVPPACRGAPRCANCRSAAASPPYSTFRTFDGAGVWGPSLDLVPPLSPAADGAQPRAIPRWVGPGGVMPVNRTNAVTLTAMAPITEKTVCQVGDGIAISAIPCVAL